MTMSCFAFSRSFTIALVAVLVTLGLVLTDAQKATAQEDIVSKSVAGAYDKVVTKLKREITGHKLVIVKVVPFQQMLSMVGVKTPKIKAFEIFHPRYGKVLYKVDANALLEAPLRILVSESSGKVTLRYRKPSVIFAPYSGLGDLGQELDEVVAFPSMKLPQLHSEHDAQRAKNGVVFAEVLLLLSE